GGVGKSLTLVEYEHVFNLERTHPLGADYYVGVVRHDIVRGKLSVGCDDSYIALEYLLVYALPCKDGTAVGVVGYGFAVFVIFGIDGHRLRRTFGGIGVHGFALVLAVRIRLGQEPPHELVAREVYLYALRILGDVEEGH